MSVRVRFAPSPTGLLHVGALRTALYCSLFAKKHGGVNYLRIEDTDRTRYNADSEAEFVSTLEWVGITFNEGPHIGGEFAPYRQSERKAANIYQPFADELIAKGCAYRAFETPEELEEMRTFQQVNKMPFGYFGGEWRDASEAKVQEALAAGKPHVIRLKIPRNTIIRGEDAIRGRLEWDSNTIDDPVLIKADGMPTYHMAAMVDDHLMKTSHVFRGEEWISSYPKHIYLHQALGWDLPIFVHCPVITGNDGKKLSKRHGATRVLDYAAMGILPDPLKNFVALIGWAPGEDREVLTPTELVELFGIEGLQPSPGRFDFQKLLWMNGLAIRALTPEQILDQLTNLTQSDHAKQYWAEDDEELGKLNAQQTWSGLVDLVNLASTEKAKVLLGIAITQERATTLVEFGDLCSFFVQSDLPMDEKAASKWKGQAHITTMFDAFIEALKGKDSASVEECEAMVRGWAHANGYEKIGPVVHPTRLALTGRSIGPGLFELMNLLGPSEMIRRFEKAKSVLA